MGAWVFDPGHNSDHNPTEPFNPTPRPLPRGRQTITEKLSVPERYQWVHTPVYNQRWQRIAIPMYVVGVRVWMCVVCWEGRECRYISYGTVRVRGEE